ncbi:MAG: hypothetical protein L0H39_01885, partial [Brachybacterium sp.]|nr:hypothetical protein [Brachybacterium sp.]
MTRLPVVVLISGTGSNLAALLTAARAEDCPYAVVAVIADRDAAGLEHAQAAGIPTQIVRLADHPDRSAWDTALADAVARGPLTAADEAAWNAPYGRAEHWDLRIEHREAQGPHGPVPLRVYTPIAPADGPRAVLVFCHGGSFQHGDLTMPE